MRQVFVDRIEFSIAHSSDWPPWHFLAEFVSVGINTNARRGYELLKLPCLDKIEVGPEQPKLSGNTTGHFGAVARAAMKRFLVRHARRPEQAKSAAMMINIATMNNSNIEHPLGIKQTRVWERICRSHPLARQRVTKGGR